MSRGRPTLKLPKIKAPKIPFLGKKESGEPDNDEAAAPEVPSDLDYLEASSFQKKLPLIGAIAGWVLTICIIGGIATYVMISEDDIMQSMVEARPATEVDEIVIIREENTQSGETETAEGHSETIANTESESDLTNGEPRNDAYAGLLQPHPDPGLIEQDAVGPLPITGSDGRVPWRVYSRPSNPIETRPRIAIVIAGLGINKKTTEAALNLSGEISLAFSPHASGLDKWITTARDLGHETLLTLPMEPSDFPKSDPGPYALMSTMDTEQNTKRLEWILSRATGYIGLISYQGSGFAANNRAMRPLMGNLKSRGLLYIDAKQSVSSIAPAIARAAGVPNAQADIVLDRKLSRAEILKQLKLVESLARANGSVIAVGHPYPVTLERIRLWARELPENGFVLSPVSGIIDKRIQG